MRSQFLCIVVFHAIILDAATVVRVRTAVLAFSILRCRLFCRHSDAP